MHYAHLRLGLGLGLGLALGLGLGVGLALVFSETNCTVTVYFKGASQLVTRSTRHSPKSYDELTGG